MGSIISKNGAPGSGNWGHQGRRGKVGGSLPSKGNKALSDWQKDRNTRVAKVYGKAAAELKKTNFDEWKKLYYGGYKKGNHWVANPMTSDTETGRLSILKSIKGGTETNPARVKKKDKDKKKEAPIKKKVKKTPKDVENELEQCKKNSIAQSMKLMDNIFKKYKKKIF